MITTEEDYAFPFFEHVEEVYGNIEIDGGRLTEISFPNLIIIRGQKLNSKPTFSGMLLYLRVVVYFWESTFFGDSQEVEGDNFSH